MIDKTNNVINTLYPYRTHAGWAFDDEDVELYEEAFVLGIPEIIDSIVGEKDSFVVYISEKPIPQSTGVLINIDEEKQDEVKGWYKYEGSEMEGWLCEATLKYFKNYPTKIYFKIVI